LLLRVHTFNFLNRIFAKNNNTSTVPAFAGTRMSRQDRQRSNKRERLQDEGAYEGREKSSARGNAPLKGEDRNKPSGRNWYLQRPTTQVKAVVP
jgi:hypothetical protein